MSLSVWVIHYDYYRVYGPRCGLVNSMALQFHSSHPLLSPRLETQQSNKFNFPLQFAICSTRKYCADSEREFQTNNSLICLYNNTPQKDFLITDFCIAILHDHSATFHTDGCSCTFWNNGIFCFDLNLVCHQLFNVGKKMMDSSDFNIDNLSHGQSIFLLH